jgi:hypothetical protein
MLPWKHLLVAILLSPAVSATAEAADPPQAADAIMSRVAANQDQTEAARQHYIYLQHIRMVSRKPGGRVMCEEITDSRVSPQQHESHQELLQLNGRYWIKGRYLNYTTLPRRNAAGGSMRRLTSTSAQTPVWIATWSKTCGTTWLTISPRTACITTCSRSPASCRHITAFSCWDANP